MSIILRYLHYVPTGHDHLSVFHGNILPARNLPMEGSPEEKLKILDPGPGSGEAVGGSSQEFSNDEI